MTADAVGSITADADKSTTADAKCSRFRALMRSNACNDGDRDEGLTRAFATHLLGLARDIDLLAANDATGRRLQDLALGLRSRATRKWAQSIIGEIDWDD